MQGINGKYLNSKIKAYIYVSSDEIQEVAEEIEASINKILIDKCGAGNFLSEIDVKY